MPLELGTKLGPYEIQSPLGAGAMGEVYRARDTRLERTVAIKILPAQVSNDPVRKQRFEREAKTISSLNHPHICVLYDVGVQDGTHYLVMECVEGETLAKRLEKGPLPLEQVLKYGAQIADALDKAHRAGIVHRDLKPGNVMLTAAGAKLLDFGLAKPAALVSEATLTGAATQTTPVTQEGTIVGTFQYMSPEQVEGTELDGRSDIFSLGAVLYEMLTGQRAFPGKSQLSVASAILEKEPAPISSLKPLTPPALDHAIRRCLAKEPEKRWQSAVDLAGELQWIAESGSPAGVAAPGVPLRKLHERIAWITAVAVLTIAAALFGIGYFSRTPEIGQPIISQILPPENTKFMFTGLSGGPPVLSPDGNQLAFAARGADGKQFLWVHSLKDATEQPLAGTEGATVPFWSPDSRSLGFFANGKLNRIDVAGGPVLTLCDTLSSRGADWGTDGTIVFSYLSGPIFRVSASGGTPQPVTKLNESLNEFSHRWPQFLPDGRHFLFLAGGSPYANSAVYMGSLDSGDPKLVLRNNSNAIYAAPGYLLYVRQNTLLAQPFDANKLQLTGDAVPLTSHGVADTATHKGLFSASQNGILVYASGTSSEARVLWFDRNGRQTGETGTAAVYGFPRISPDGHKLAVPRFLAADSIPVWIFDLERGNSSRLTFDPGVYYAPVWSPDGKSIAFSFGQGGRRNIYQQSANGAGASVPLVAGETDKTLPAWSPDGRYIIFQRHPEGNSPWEIWAMPLFGDRKAFPVVHNPQFLQGDPVVSPDGKWLAYDSDESGRIEAYLTAFPGGGGKWQVSTSGGTCPRWGADGRELFYMSLDNKVMSAEISEQASSVVIGKVHPLFQANPVPTAPECMYDVTPDGKRFVVVTLAGEQGAQPLMLAVNWPALLKKQRQP